MDSKFQGENETDAIQNVVGSEAEREDYCHESGTLECFDTVNVTNTSLKSLESLGKFLSKHSNSLQTLLGEFDDDTTGVSDRIKLICEKAVLYRTTMNVLINTVNECLELMDQECVEYEKKLNNESRMRVASKELLRKIVTQRSRLEKAMEQHPPVKILSLPIMEESDEESDVYRVPVKDKIEIDAASEKTVITVGPPAMKMKDLVKRAVSFRLKRDQCKIADCLKDNMMDDTVNTIKCYKHTNYERQTIVEIESPQKFEGNNFQHVAYSVYDVPSTSTESQSKKQRRTRIKDKPNYPLSLWGIMKNCIGKDLSKIPMPVNFSEPLSMLQRLVETIEYSEVLDYAVCCKDVYEQIAYIAAFTVSGYATTSNRSAKPFNPLLGETYEWDRREDLGWRLITEQVSHHPPISALHCEGKDWTLWQDFSMVSKFRGKYIQVVPIGTVHLLTNSGQHYTWKKVMTTVHNIIVGKLWVDQHGEMDIVNHNTGTKCHLTYTPYTVFSSKDSQRKVTGVVTDEKGQAKWTVKGTWDNKVDIAQVLSVEGSKDNPVYKMGEIKTAWQVRPPPDDCEKYYNFTVFACQLNELEEGVAPTDTRKRPDQRLMENGNWDEANVLKVKLEEKQRAVRKQREEAAAGAAASTVRSASVIDDIPMQSRAKNEDLEPPANVETLEDSGSLIIPSLKDTLSEAGMYQATWFKTEVDPITGDILHAYKGGYWEAKERQDWSMCPDIYNV